MLTVVTYRWGRKYGPEYVDRLSAGLKRHLQQPHRFMVINPENGPDEALTKIPGCFCRLRMFDPQWQAEHKITERLVCIDLDLVITGPLDPLFDRAENFVILTGANAKNPCPFNGSLMMLRAGAHPEIWADFSLDAAAKIPFYEFPDDQGWFWHELPSAAGWNVGPQSGIWSFAKRGWPKDNRLPDGARAVAFPGWRDPSKFTQLDWVKTHWRE